jgi:hypothetical protein
MSDVLAIVTDYLKAHGFDGLCCDGCGCEVDRLLPCGSTCQDCRPAYKCATCGGFFPTREHEDHEEAENA